MSIKLVSFLGLFAVVMLPLQATADQHVPSKLTFSIIENSDAQNAVKFKLLQVYKKLAVEVDFLNLPSNRALEFSNNGRTDGETFRIKSISKTYKNLVRVPTPVMSFEGFAYATRNLEIESWLDLKGLRVGIVRGIIWSEKQTKDYAVSRFNNNEDLLDKLLMGGIDVAVTTSFGMSEVTKNKILKVKLHRGKSLAQFDVYHFLHKKYQYLIDRVDLELMAYVNGEIFPNARASRLAHTATLVIK